MSTFEPWDTPGSAANGGGAPQGYPGNAGYPGHQGYPGYPGNAPGQWAGAGGGFQARRVERGRVLRIIGMVLFLLAAIANALDVFGPDETWKNPADWLLTVLFTMTCLLTAFMLVPAKTRGLGAGLALGQALAETARLINEVSPSSFDQFNLVEKLSFTGSYVLTALGGIVVAIALLLERGSTGRGTAMPLQVLLLGIPGTLLWTIGAVQADYAWTYEGAGSQSFACCAWSTSDGVGKASDVLIAVALLAIVLIAALVRRPGLAKGLLAGAAVLMLSEAIDEVMSVVAPNATAYGIGGGSGEDSISAQAKSGLWFALAGLVLLAIAFFIQRGGEGTTSQSAPYAAPTAGFAGPGTAAPGYPPSVPPSQPPSMAWGQSGLALSQPPPQPPLQQPQPPSPQFPPQPPSAQPPEYPPSSSGPPV